ncbi:MAG: hypothetical protein IKW24_02185, partial [Clostridia bacterium]|nr:hypothetical protein [Clostridia bacterium]
MNKSMFIDAVGMIDADIVEAYILKDNQYKAGGKRNRGLSVLLVAAVALMLSFALLLTSLPLIYVSNPEGDSFIVEI